VPPSGDAAFGARHAGPGGPGPVWIRAVNHGSEGEHPAARLAASDLTPAYGELQNLLLNRPDVVGFLQQLASLCAALVPRTSCAVTMRRNHQIATVASSDEFAVKLGEIQYDRGQGPCLQVLRTGERVKVRDMATDDRWGGYRLHALAAGVRSSVSLPLTVNDAAVGAVSLYSRARNSFGKKDIRRAETLTLQAAAALTLLLRSARQTEPGTTLAGDDVEELHRELDEAHETLRTIRAGGFDALIIDTGAGADRPSRLPAEGVSEKGQEDPEHRWYRLLSMESFTAGCPCGWVSPERDTADEMMRDVDRHLEEVRQARTARA